MSNLCYKSKTLLSPLHFQMPPPLLRESIVSRFAGQKEGIKFKLNYKLKENRFF